MTEQPNVEYGDREIAFDNEILRTTVGSELHGIHLPGTEDHDELGIYVEPPWLVLGVRPDFETSWRDSYISRTKPEGVRSGPGDTDLVIYALRKFLHLAVKGNPTVLLPLFAPKEQILVQTAVGMQLRQIRTAFLSAYAVERFLAYMNAQHERMLGYGKRSNVPNRPELIEQYGFDVKFAAHALRLAYQGQEIARLGHLNLPMSEALREQVLAVKKGEVPIEEVSRRIVEVADNIKLRLAGRASLAVPPRPNTRVINDFARSAHLAHWNRTGQL